MTTTEVKTRLVAYLDGKENLDSLWAWLLPVSREASKHGVEFETLLGSVGNLFARLGAGLMTESDFLNNLRMLADQKDDPEIPSAPTTAFTESDDRRCNRG